MLRPRTIAMAGFAMVAWLSTATGQAPPRPPATPAPPVPAATPGKPAPPEIVSALRQALAEAIQRFEKMDTEGVLIYVSDRYHSGSLTKPFVREQLRAMFAVNDQVRAHVQIDEVRMIGDRAWVYSTGDVTGRIRLVGTTTSLFAWQHEPDVAWQEGGRWRLIGDQQP